MWGSEFTTKAAKKLELIQTQTAQKIMMRADVHARALRSSQNLIRIEVWAATLRGKRVSAQSFCSGLWPNFARAYGSRSFPDGRASRAATRANFRSRAWYVVVARGLVVKHVDAAELRVVSPNYSPSPPMPCSSYTTILNSVPIWLPHWLACKREI